MSLEQVVYRIVTDSKFAASMNSNPEAALHRSDIDLSEGERQALLAALEARKEQKNGPIGRTWLESRLGDDPGKDQLQGRTWLESRLGEDPGTAQPQGRTWLEDQLGVEAT